MKKIFALLLCVCVFVGLTACGGRKKAEQPDNKTYLVSMQKTLQADEVTRSASFSYDEKGRPILMEIKTGKDRSMIAEIVYDSHGNKVAEFYNNFQNGSTIQQEIHYNLTYTGDQITHCDMSVSNNRKVTDMGFDLHYDAAGRLVLLTYDERYTTYRQVVWHSFEYDAAGRLVRETQCQKYASASLANPEDTYKLAQCRYDYTEDGKVMNFGVYTAETTTPVTPDNLQGLTFVSTPDAYSFCFDDAGKLMYVGSGPEDVYQAGDETVYDNKSYTFDKNGNLLSTVQNGTGNTFGYTGFNLTQQEAEMAKRLQHGISEAMTTYMALAHMDPIYCEIGPMLLYAPMLQNPVYYLVPYPMWGAV